MSDRGKKIFLGICILIPFVLYSIYYYSIMVKNAPYKFSEFESFELKYGLGDNLVNTYDSKTGIYRYENDRDSIVTDTVRLNKDDLLYLHRKAVDLGFWNFPEELSGANNPKRSANSPHYFLKYNYQRKSKQVMLDLDYNDNEKLRDAAKQLIDVVSKTINDAGDRQ
jgi:hypothetical protein